MIIHLTHGLIKIMSQNTYKMTPKNENLYFKMTQFIKTYDTN